MASYKTENKTRDTARIGNCKANKRYVFSGMIVSTQSHGR
jgi:hypothetical protein